MYLCIHHILLKIIVYCLLNVQLLCTLPYTYIHKHTHTYVHICVYVHVLYRLYVDYTLHHLYDS